MTVQTEFWDWGRNPMTPDPGRCAPICQTWMSYLLATWAGQNLGCYAPRPVVGGSTPSTHASGAAIDWRYQDPGMGRTAMLDVVMPWLLDQSRQLGVQAVHDYVGCRIWRPPGTSGRPAGGVETGWRQQTPGSQMGQPWALWLHIECLNTRWSDPRTVPGMLGPTPDPTPDPDEEDDDMPKPLLVRNSAGSPFAIATPPTGKFALWAEDYSALAATGQYEVCEGMLDSTIARIPDIGEPLDVRNVT